MQPINKIPSEWWRDQYKPAHFITYWGDIYSGTLTEIHGYEKGFFIVPNYNLRKLHELTNANQKNSDTLRKIGWEINDHRVIKRRILIDGNSSPFNEAGHLPISFSNERFSKMFVFGAGASTFCCFDDHAKRFSEDDLKPPICFEIFHERYDSICANYPGVQFSIPDFESKGNSIEVCLEEEWLRYRSIYNPQVAMRHINVQFYLQELFQTVTDRVASKYFRKNLYSLFANKLQNYCSRHDSERPILTSFNYDTILEHFIEQAFGPKYQTLGDYIDWRNRNVVIFKPHGSSNWGWKFPSEITPDFKGNISARMYEMKTEPHEIFYQMLGDVSEMVYSGSYGYELNDDEGQLSKHGPNKQLIEVIQKNQGGQYYPAMLLPYRDKDEFIMPYNHMIALDAVFNHVEELFLIGWKGNEQLFNRKLKDGLTRCKKIVIVNPDADGVLKNLEPFVDLRAVDIVKIATFEDFVLKHLDGFLE